MTSVKGDGQQEEQDLSGSDTRTSLAAVLQRRLRVFVVHLYKLLAGGT